jgi:hypothetical protein
MHKSLSLRTNITLAGAMALVLAMCVYFDPTLPAATVAAFAAVGVFGGYLQGRAVRGAPSIFLAADTWSSVRSGLWRSWPGKLSHGLTWANGLCLLLFILSRPTPSTAAILACYAAFTLSREISTMPGLYYLGAMQRAKDAH